jgi:hypothetical protein
MQARRLPTCRAQAIRRRPDQQGQLALRLAARTAACSVFPPCTGERRVSAWRTSHAILKLWHCVPAMLSSFYIDEPVMSEVDLTSLLLHQVALHCQPTRLYAGACTCTRQAAPVRATMPRSSSRQSVVCSR